MPGCRRPRRRAPAPPAARCDSRPTARSWANIDGVVSIRSMPYRAMVVDQCLGVALHVVADDVHRVPVEQRGQRLPGRVERERPGVRDAQRAAQPGCGGPQDVARVVLGVGQQRVMGADDALGLSGGAGGEHHVGGLSRAGRSRAGSRRRSRRRSLPNASSMMTVAPVWRRMSRDAFGRHRRVQRHDHAAGLEHAQHRDDVVGSAAKGDRHRGFGAALRARPAPRPAGRRPRRVRGR